MLKTFNADENVIVIDYITACHPASHVENTSCGSVGAVSA